MNNEIEVTIKHEDKIITLVLKDDISEKLMLILIEDTLKKIVVKTVKSITV